MPQVLSLWPQDFRPQKLTTATDRVYFNQPFVRPHHAAATLGDKGGAPRHKASWNHGGNTLAHRGHLRVGKDNTQRRTPDTRLNHGISGRIAACHPAFIRRSVWTRVQDSGIARHEYTG